MENRRFYMKREVFLFVVTALLFINEVYIIIKIVQDGFTRSNTLDLIGWGLVLFVGFYGLLQVARKKVYIEFKEDEIFYKGLFTVEKRATYNHKYEYRKDIRNKIKRISFYGEKEVTDLVINRYSFPQIKSIVEELESRVHRK